MIFANVIAKVTRSLAGVEIQSAVVEKNADGW